MGGRYFEWSGADQLGAVLVLRVGVQRLAEEEHVARLERAVDDVAVVQLLQPAALEARTAQVARRVAEVIVQPCMGRASAEREARRREEAEEAARRAAEEKARREAEEKATREAGEKGGAGSAQGRETIWMKMCQVRSTSIRSCCSCLSV